MTGQKSLQGRGMEHHSNLLVELRKLLNEDSDAVPLRELLENLPVSVVYVDAQQIIRIVNREFEKWYARPRSQILGRSMREVTGDDERYFATQKLVQNALHGYKTSFFLPKKYPDGKERYIAAYLEPDIAPTGKVLGYVGVYCPVPLSGDEAQHIFDDRGFRRIGDDA